MRRGERIEGGETFYDVRDRFEPFIKDLIGKYRSTDANLLCVGHGGLYAHMLPLVLNNISPEFVRKQMSFPYTDVIVTELTPAGLVCREWGGTKMGG